MPFLRTLIVAALLASSTAFGAPLSAQALRDGPGGEPPLTLTRSAGLVVPDGDIGDAEWAGAVEIVGMMHLPDFGAEPSERTEFLLAYDDDFLYVGCRAYDRDPAGIRVTTLWPTLMGCEPSAGTVDMMRKLVAAIGTGRGVRRSGTGAR